MNRHDLACVPWASTTCTDVSSPSAKAIRQFVNTSLDCLEDHCRPWCAEFCQEWHLLSVTTGCLGDPVNQTSQQFLFHRQGCSAPFLLDSTVFFPEGGNLTKSTSPKSKVVIQWHARDVQSLSHAHQWIVRSPIFDVKTIPILMIKAPMSGLFVDWVNWTTTNNAFVVYQIIDTNYASCPVQTLRVQYRQPINLLPDQEVSEPVDKRNWINVAMAREWLLFVLCVCTWQAACAVLLHQPSIKIKSIKLKRQKYSPLSPLQMVAMLSWLMCWSIGSSQWTIPRLQFVLQISSATWLCMNLMGLIYELVMHPRTIRFPDYDRLLCIRALVGWNLGWLIVSFLPFETISF